jgi:hypothetical protein
MQPKKSQIPVPILKVTRPLHNSEVEAEFAMIETNNNSQAFIIASSISALLLCKSMITFRIGAGICEFIGYM